MVKLAMCEGGLDGAAENSRCDLTVAVFRPVSGRSRRHAAGGSSEPETMAAEGIEKYECLVRAGRCREGRLRASAM